jgi:hypothetical protein
MSSTIHLSKVAFSLPPFFIGSNLKPLVKLSCLNGIASIPYFLPGLLPVFVKDQIHFLPTALFSVRRSIYSSKQGGRPYKNEDIEQEIYFRAAEFERFGGLD